MIFGPVSMDSPMTTPQVHTGIQSLVPQSIEEFFKAELIASVNKFDSKGFFHGLPKLIPTSVLDGYGANQNKVSLKELLQMNSSAAARPSALSGKEATQLP